MNKLLYLMVSISFIPSVYGMSINQPSPEKHALHLEDQLFLAMRNENLKSFTFNLDKIKRNELARKKIFIEDTFLNQLLNAEISPDNREKMMKLWVKEGGDPQGSLRNKWLQDSVARGEASLVRFFLSHGARDADGSLLKIAQEKMAQNPSYKDIAQLLKR